MGVAWLLEFPACIFLNKRISPLLWWFLTIFSSSHASVSLDSPLSAFPFLKMPSQEGPWSQLLEPCVKVHRWVPSPWESEFQPSFSMGKTDCIMGEGLRQHQAGRAPGSAETAGSSRFSGVGLHTGVNVPHCSVGLLVGARLCLCSASRLGIEGQRLDQRPQSGWGRGFFRSSWEVGGF